MRGQTSGGWLRDEVHILPDMRGPLDYAINQFSIPRPPGNEDVEYNVGFQLDLWSPFASLSSIFDQNRPVNAGFAVDDGGPHPSAQEAVSSSQQVGNIFTGIVVDAAVSDSDAWLYRLGYNITLEGRIVFTEIPRAP